MKNAKSENYRRIYGNAAELAKLHDTVKPMMWELYDQLLEDLRLGKTGSPIFRHHVDYVNKTRYQREKPYLSCEPDQIVVDYIASMTDDYFIDLHRHLFPDSDYRVEYTGYFDERGNDDV
jgi:dGTPase